MSNENIEMTRKGYEAFSAGDLDAALSVFDDSVQWTVPGESMLSGTYRGKDELTGLLMRLAEKSAQVEPKRFLGDGDVVVVISQVTAGGETSEEAGVYEFRDGKVVKAQSFGDTAMQERVYGSKRVTAG